MQFSFIPGIWWEEKEEENLKKKLKAGKKKRKKRKCKALHNGPTAQVTRYE